MINYCVRQQRWSTSYQCKRCFMTASYLSWLLIKPCCCSCSCPTKLFSEGRMHCMDQSWRQSRRWSIAGLFNSIRLNDGWLIRNWEFSSHLNCFKYLSPRHERHKKFQWWCPCEVWPKTGKGGLNWCTTTQLPNVYPGVCVCAPRALTNNSGRYRCTVDSHQISCWAEAPSKFFPSESENLEGGQTDIFSD